MPKHLRYVLRIQFVSYEVFLFRRALPFPHQRCELRFVIFPQILMTPKQQLQASLANIDKSVTTTLQSRLSTIHANDSNITKQTKTLQAQTHEARKQQDNWDNVVRAGRNGLKVSVTPVPKLIQGHWRRKQLG